MVIGLALVVAEPSTAANELCAALRRDGTPVRQLSPGRLRAGWRAEEGTPDLVLVGATLEVDLVRRLVRQVMQVTGHPPTVVAFSEAGPGPLEPHVRAGLDYLVPPYLPGLVSSRLIACHLRQLFSRTAEEFQTSADLTRYERELRIGQEIQAGFLPKSLPVRTGWQLTARFQPARVVAGDFYDAFELRDGTRIGLVVADVCDKGVGAALFMALVRSLLRHTATCLEPAELQPTAGADAALLLRSVATTNQYLITNHLGQGYFATLFFGVLDPLTGSLVYANCGHASPVIRRADGVRKLLGPTGPALGVIPNAGFAVDRIWLEPGDLLFAYTDGVPEARDAAGRLLSRGVLHELIAAHRSGTDELLDQVEQAISAHMGAAEQSDDITMVALRRHPSSRWDGPAQL